MNLITELFSALLRLKNSSFSFSQKLHLAWILIKLTFLKVLQKNVQPAKIKVFGFVVEDYNYRLLDYLIKEVFVGNEYNFKAEKLNPIIFDCGANIGMATIFFKWLYPNATIYAFEPQKKTFEFLQKNIQNNHLENVHCYNIALSDYDGKITFYESDSSNLMASILENRVEGTKIEVECLRLSTFLKEPIDLLKIDVEGAENIIVKDLVENQKLNKQNIKLIIMEYHHKIPNQKSAMSSFLQPFEENNFEYQIRTDFPKLDAFQDMLIHFF